MQLNQLLHPHDELSGTEVMIDYLDDNLRRVKRYLKDIDETKPACTGRLTLLPTVLQ